MPLRMPISILNSSCFETRFLQTLKQGGFILELRAMQRVVPLIFPYTLNVVVKVVEIASNF